VRIGAHYLGNGECEFTVWAPIPEKVAVQILSPHSQTIEMKPLDDGYWQVVAQDIYPGTRYRFEIGDQEAHPDPASRFQPDGVHGDSQVVELSHNWTNDDWQGIPLASMIMYELHVGTFTPEGTFKAMIPRLPNLRETGINAIEIMPIAQFPGDDHAKREQAYRNWGYDGVFPYAVQNSYGTPQELMELVDACHQHGIAVILDVVYNHFGPEGNYISHFAPYFTETYNTPWGSAINFDDAYSHHVRNYFLENALYWLRDFHIDALRLDAVQAIYDLGAKHFLWELADTVHELSQASGQKRYLIAESDLNNPILIRPVELGGYNLDAQWSDDFHHSLHTLVTSDRQGYYQDFGKCSHLAKAYEDTFVYDWKYAPHRHRFHGISCRDRSPTQFVVCIQNHDQVGNQMLGERLIDRTSYEGVKLAAGALLLSPHIPLLFMGEEYGETAPFTYFVSHSDPELIKAVRQGRKKEFEAFHYDGEPPDPEAAETYCKSKLNWDLRHEGKHHTLLNWYRHLITLRQSHPALLKRDRDFIQAIGDDEKHTVILRRWCETTELVIGMNFGSAPVPITLPIHTNAQKVLDSAALEWSGHGTEAPTELVPDQPFVIQAQSLVVYEQKN